ncbi:MAG TPA: S-formylglutathione hydrolase [Dongiaceae bacterium]|nr:S-formylglutathione hydrolase [Dongiaceae bacterium]
MSLSTLSKHACFGGWQGFYSHASREIGLEMKFAVFVPPQAEHQKRPVLTYLAGLTCTEETFIIKAGAQRLAAELGLILVAPDTSPRGTDFPGQADSWDFGVGAGFYIDATQSPWSQHWRMGSYITKELPQVIAANFPADMEYQGIFGHSMGGHGALVLALRNPHLYRSLSAFAPICAPTRCPWGFKAFSGYLGDDKAGWTQYDATELVADHAFSGEILIDQGLDDKFLAEQLHPHLFEAAARKAGQKLVLRRHAGYDHGYFFIQTFMEDHLRHHASVLCAKPASPNDKGR